MKFFFVLIFKKNKIYKLKMFDNDHLLIDNELLTMENELIKINDIKSIFYSINSMEDFKKFRTMIGQFISTFENEIELILNSIKKIFNIQIGNFMIHMQNYKMTFKMLIQN